MTPLKEHRKDLLGGIADPHDSLYPDLPADDSEANLLRRLNHLNELTHKYHSSWSLQIVEERVDYARTSVELAQNPVPDSPRDTRDDDAPQPCEFALALASALNDRFMHSGTQADAEEVIELVQQMIPSAGVSSHIFSTALREQGRALRHRASLVQDMDPVEGDLHQALALHRHALFLTPTDSGTTYTAAITEVATTLLHSFLRFDVLRDLDESVALLRTALELSTPRGQNHHEVLRMLSTALFEKYLNAGLVRELKEEAESLAREALEICPQDHPMRPFALCQLSQILIRIFRETGDLSMLDTAYQHCQDGITACGPRHPARVHLLETLSDVLYWRADYRGKEKEINECYDYAQAALSLCPPGHPMRRVCLERNARALSERGTWSGGFSDLEAGIGYQREAFHLLSPTAFRYEGAMSDLAFFIMRVTRMKGTYDIVWEAVELFRRALNHPREGPTPVRFKSNLGLALTQHFLFSGDLNDLMEAIDLHHQAVHEETPTNVHYRWFVERHAQALCMLWERDQDSATLDQVIAARERALEVWPKSDTHRALPLQSLAESLCDRYERQETTADIERAAALLDSALCSAPAGHYDRPRVLFCMAKLYMSPWSSFFDLDRALDYITYGISCDYVGVQQRLARALERLETFEARLGNAGWQPEFRSKLLQVYRLAISLLPRVAFFGLQPTTRLEVLSKGKDLASNAASHALQLDQPDTAMEILEEGRAVFWTQCLRLRSSFDELPSDLAAKLLDLSRKLDSDEPQPGGKGRINDQFDSLIRQTRLLPRFSRFMLHDTFDALLVAASRGPVLVLLASQASCYAVVMESSSSKPRSVLLEDLSLPELLVHQRTMEALEEGARGFRRRGNRTATGQRLVLPRGGGSLEVYSRLWSKVMKPVISALNMKKENGRRRPRLFMCLTGAFTHLPVHAAGEYRGEDPECCSDYFVASHTPTLGALIRARHNFGAPSRAMTKVLLAAVPNPFQWEPLMHAVEEVACVKRTVPHEALVELPQINNESRDEVKGARAIDILSRISQASILHVACHGMQHRTDPLQSGFVMRDKMLTVSELMAINHPSAFLAFLSACETARGDEKQPDQAVHLAATMLFAGFRSVIATLWSMGDMDGPAVAAKVYGDLFAVGSDVLEPDAVPYALDAAVQELRAQAVHPSRWGTYIHIGL